MKKNFCLGLKPCQKFLFTNCDLYKGYIHNIAPEWREISECVFHNPCDIRDSGKKRNAPSHANNIVFFRKPYLTHPIFCHFVGNIPKSYRSYTTPTVPMRVRMDQSKKVFKLFFSLRLCFPCSCARLFRGRLNLICEIISFFMAVHSERICCFCSSIRKLSV